MSGYTEHAAVKHSALEPDDHFIEKPFAAVGMSVAVRRTLTSDT